MRRNLNRITGTNRSLVQGANGNFYGTTSIGGANVTACANGAYGTVFEISPTGKLTTVYSFCAQTNCTDGAQPNAGLVLGNDGSLYGTTVRGGAAGGGEVFKITTKGALTVLHSFEGVMVAIRTQGLCKVPTATSTGRPWRGSWLWHGLQNET